jgi:hypothetical protein
MSDLNLRGSNRQLNYNFAIQHGNRCSHSTCRRIVQTRYPNSPRTSTAVLSVDGRPLDPKLCDLIYCSISNHYKYSDNASSAAQRKPNRVWRLSRLIEFIARTTFCQHDGIPTTATWIYSAWIRSASFLPARPRSSSLGPQPWLDVPSDGRTSC